jgi:predicted nucleic acid-binding protein
MVLVDTSVLISYLRGQVNSKTELLDEVLDRDVPFGIACYTFQEVLQGARDEAELRTLKEYLSTQVIYYLEQTRETYENAAMLYFRLRRKGITPRSTVDVLIALTAIANNLSLLHDDRDFDVMSQHLQELRVLDSL